MMFLEIVASQFNKKYPSGAEKNKKKQESIKVDEKCKGFLDRFVVVTSGTGEPTEESAGQAPKLLTVAMSAQCIIRCAIHKTQVL